MVDLFVGKWRHCTIDEADGRRRKGCGFYTIRSILRLVAGETGIGLGALRHVRRLVKVPRLNWLVVGPIGFVLRLEDRIQVIGFRRSGRLCDWL